MTAVDFAAFVDDLATASGDAILPFFRTSLGVENKNVGGSFDPVTAADRAGEVTIRAMIRATFPEHGILGEEYGVEQPDAEYVWIIDPIDGTKSFISGMPIWGTLIGLTRAGKSVYGMMHQPFTRERFTGDGMSAHYRGPAGDCDLHVRPCSRISDALLLTTSPLLMTSADREIFGRTEQAVRLSRYGGDCYAYCMLAAGHVDLVIETGLHPHDIVALVPVVTGAGGFISTWEGEPAEGGGRIIAAGDRRVYEEARALLSA